MNDDILEFLADLVIESVDMIRDKPNLENLSSIHSNWEILDKNKLKVNILKILEKLDERYKK